MTLRLAGRSEKRPLRARLPPTPNPEATPEVALDAFSLAHAYVALDRFVFFQVQSALTFESCCEKVRERLSDVPGGLKDFDDLCAAGAEASELLWLLNGCEGLAGFTHTDQVFGWSAEELTNGLKVIEEAASVIEKVQRHPFGILAVQTPGVSQGLEKTLMAYVALARGARSDFGHGSDWFLNIAKARLVIHVTHRTKGVVHDREISGLIAATTGSEYSPSAQSQWRHKHNDLIRDSSLDPYTVMTPAQREERREAWKQIAEQDPEFFEGFSRWVADYNGITKARSRSTKPLKGKK
jgi:hypothetical protein